MPVHDWTRVRPGTFHDFHTSWITHIKETLNGGLLPRGFYAMSEQPAGETGPDVLTLEFAEPGPLDSAEDDFVPEGAVAVAVRPPKVSFSVRAEADLCASRQRTLVIRHATGDRIVALVEIVSPGNKNKEASFESFLDKAISAIKHGYHLLIIDLFPPGRFDPNGVHGAIWSQIESSDYEQPPDRPLTLAAYVAMATPEAHVEPTAVGLALPDMPLFLTPEAYVEVPLEATYQQAWQGVPQRWQNVIEAC